MDFLTIPAFVVIVYLGCEFYKTASDNHDVIPVLAGGLGLILGLIAWFFVPNVLETAHVFDAMATGIVSGLSAVGVNQIFKQNTK